jgi:polyisoprenoid-binding protein YceI
MMIMQKTILGLVLMSLSASAFGQQQADLNFVPSQSTVTFTLGDVLHTVHGRFQVKQGQIVFSPSRDAISGEIVVERAAATAAMEAAIGR